MYASAQVGMTGRNLLHLSTFHPRDCQLGLPPRDACRFVCAHGSASEPAIAARHIPFRGSYVLSQFAVDAGPSWRWAELPRPGQGIGRKGLEEE